MSHTDTRSASPRRASPRSASPQTTRSSGRSSSASRSTSPSIRLAGAPTAWIARSRAAALTALVALTLGACARTDSVLSPSPIAAPSDAPRRDLTKGGGVVISQVYGGGGNSGATLRNDFVELFNAGPNAVNITGWTVQYASTSGTTWQVTTLSGTIEPGRYYLVQEAQGNGGTVDLPAPDATGTIAMSANNGKVALSSTTAALSGSCPTGGTVIDFVGFGTANCYEGLGATGALANTTAALRKNNGATDTNDNAADFTVGTPAPRNGGTAPPSSQPVVTVTVSPSTWSLKATQTRSYTATGRDANDNVAATTFTWSSANTTVATIDATTGVATGQSLGTTTITATSANGVMGTALLTVTAGSVVVQSRTDPLPIGFQTQLFLNGGGTDNNGNPVTNTDVTWTSSNSSVVSVDAATGVITARADGQATITATAKSDGVTSGSTIVTTKVAVVGPAARVGFNTELGVPTDSDPLDDVIIARRQYTLSYNANRGGPNWVSWNLDASHKGSVARCNCFTADTALTRLGLPAYDTNDWINGGVWSRGHMSPSADWADADGDNAPTFFLSNMLPQNQTLNGGAWGDLENYLRTLAVGSTEIYIVSGGIFTKNRSGAGIDGFGFMNSLGRIAVPDSIWKVAIVVPDARDVSAITAASDVQVIAAAFPNDASGTGTWNRYATTIEKIQRSTGYDLYATITESAQCRIEVRNCLPEGSIVPASGSATATAGLPFVVNTSGVDADGSDGPWRYLLEWGDGTKFAATLSSLPSSDRPLARSKTYATPGTYTVRLTLTDRNGGQRSSTLIVTVN